MKELRRDMDSIYYKVEDATDINKVQFETTDMGIPGSGFCFFKGMGVIDYTKTFKMWLREFPRPLFLICAKKMKVIGWTYIDSWGTPALDGEPVYVLRAIEVLPSVQNRRVGTKLVLLGMSEVVGYMITKPMTQNAERFFKKIGFMEPGEFRRPPIDLSQHYGYLILPPFKKRKILEGIDNYFREGRK